MTTILVANTVVLAGSLVFITVLTVSYLKMKKQIHEIKKDRNYERRHDNGSKNSF